MKCNISEKQFFLTVWLHLYESWAYCIGLHIAASSNVTKQSVLLGPQTGCGSLDLVSHRCFVEAAECCLIGSVGADKAPLSHPESLLAE